MPRDDTTRAGRGKPPAEHQFSPGRSGNPKGRRRGTRNTKTIVQAIANERHKLELAGRKRTMNTVELLVHVLKKRSLQGSVKANKLLDKYRLRFAPEPSGMPKYGLYPEALTVDEWIERYSPKVDPSVGFSD